MSSRAIIARYRAQRTQRCNVRRFAYFLAKISKIRFHEMNVCILGFLGSLISNMTLKIRNTNWRIQYGARKY